MVHFTFILSFWTLLIATCATKTPAENEIVQNSELKLSLQVNNNIPYIESVTYGGGEFVRIFDKSKGRM